MNTNRIKGKWVLITGATAGIGKAVARQFAAMGSSLVINGRRNERLVELQEELEEKFGIDVISAPFDVRDHQACASFINSLDHPVDILVNNAGLARGTDPVHEGDFDDWDTMIDTNIRGVLHLSRIIGAGMNERNSGHIINVGSIAGHEAYPGGAVYCATKHAVKAITEATKKDLHGTKVRVSMVSPGLVETEFSNVRFYGDEEKASRVYRNMQPLVAEDIAEIIVFIANRPPHVNIMDTIVFPVDQSSSTMVHRDEN